MGLYVATLGRMHVEQNIHRKRLSGYCSALAIAVAPNFKLRHYPHASEPETRQERLDGRNKITFTPGRGARGSDHKVLAHA